MSKQSYKSKKDKKRTPEDEWSEDEYISGETEHTKQVFSRLMLAFVAGLFMTGFTGAIFLNSWTEVLLVFVIFWFGFYISATFYKIP